MYGEGKSNYFKGSILILSYLVVIIGFYFSSFNSGALSMVDEMDTLAMGVSPLHFKKDFIEYRARNEL
jgi:Ca2+:H+ antiporter